MRPYRSTFAQSLLLISIVCSLMLISTSFFDGGEASAQGGYSVSASPGSVHMGQPISVSWTAPSGASASDWIGIYKVGDPDSSYITYIYTQGASSGTTTFYAPAFYGVASGQVEFRYFVNNGYGRAATGNTVTATNQPPMAVADTYNFNGSGNAGPLLANDSDPDGDSISYSTTLTYTSHGILFGLSQPDIKYYAAERAYLGTDNFSYRVCDMYQLCATAAVTINLVNQPPVVGDDSYNVRGTTTIGPYFANDYDPDGGAVSDYDGVGVTFPQHGTLYGLTTADTHSFVPEPGYAGSDTFTYKVYDSFGAYTIGTVTLFIIADGENAGAKPCCNQTISRPSPDGGEPNAYVGKPINVTNGNMYVQETDYQLPAVGEAINVTRTYNSILQNIGLFGRGWSTAYDESIQAYDNKLLRLNLPDGRAVYFGRMTTTGAFSSLAPDFRGQVTKNGDGSFIVSFEDGRTHNLNAAGKLLTLTDHNNNQTSLTYDTNGKLASITDAFGRVLSLTTDANGRVASLTDSMGTVATYAYGTSQELLSVTYADNSKFQFAYGYANSKLVLASVTDALGNVLESHTYDSLGRALTSEVQGGVESYTLSYVSATETDVTDGLGHVTKYFLDKSKGRNVVTRIEGSCACSGGTNVQTWTYDNKLNILSKTNAANQTTTFTYDASGNPLTVTNALGTTTLTYNSFGDALTITDPMNGVTTNTYDTHSNLLTTKDALNHTTTFTYDALGELLTSKDALNHITTLTWNTSGQLAQMTDAANHSTAYAYDTRGRITALTNALNEITSFEYDVAGRLKKVIYPDTSYVQSTYDLGGRRTKVRDARGNETNFAYDAANRLTSVTNADNKTTSYAYDLMSHLTSVTDALNRTTSYEYDSLNRLNKITHPPATSGATPLTEQIAYDVGGRVTSRTDEAGRVTGYEYDNANRLIKLTGPTSQATQYEYNARSETTAVVDALNQRYEFAHDAAGRVTQVTRSSLSMSYSYDAVGNQTQRTDYNNQTTTFAHDNLNRLTTTTYPDATTVSYAYDALSRMSSATNANGTVSLSYDSRGRVSATTDVFNQTVGYGYDANSNRTSLSLGQATSATYQYDSLNRLTQITDPANANVGYAYDATNKLTSRTLPNGVTASYLYDGLDRLTRLTDATSAATITDAQYQRNTASQITQIAEPAQIRNFTYDSADRLTSVTNPTQTLESYSYDSVGNRTASHVSSSYSYQPFNRVTSIGSNSYSYDNNGNLISKTDSSGTWAYTWDYENRLKQVTRPDSTTINYKYDALGRRIQRSKSTGGSTNFVYDGEDVLKDINSDGSTVNYLNGLGVDEKLRQTGSSGTLYFSHDYLGSTRALTDTSGNVVESISYDSFGNGASTLSRYGYTGREWDADANLYYYRNRWYDPQEGRFISEDPIGLEGGINSYAYVGNNPINLIDPSGLDGNDPGFFRLQLAYWKAVGKGAVNTVAGAPGFAYRLATDPIGTIKSAYDDISGRLKTLYEIVRHPGEGLNAIRDAIAEVGPEESMAIIGDAGGQIVGFRFLGNIQQWIKEARNCRVAQEIGILRAAASGKGNFGVGSATTSTSLRLGRAWVGEGYTIASDGKTLLSVDELRQFRPPSFKPNLGRFQANFESRWVPEGQWQTNGHLDIFP
jgi:RHS repeat-associated protein